MQLLYLKCKINFKTFVVIVAGKAIKLTLVSSSVVKFNRLTSQKKSWLKWFWKFLHEFFAHVKELHFITFSKQFS